MLINVVFSTFHAGVWASRQIYRNYVVTPYIPQLGELIAWVAGTLIEGYTEVHEVFSDFLMWKPDLLIFSRILNELELNFNF